jgi:hypothetical protein
LNTKTNMKATGILLVLILMVMTGLLYINHSNSAKSSSVQNIEPMTVVGQYEAANKTSALCTLEDLMIEATGAVVKAANMEGKSLWNKNLPGKISSMKNAGASLYILDSSKFLTCMNKDGKELWQKQLEGDIKGFYTEPGGDVLITYAYNGGLKLQIFDGRGKGEGSITLEHAELITFASGKNENTLSILDISSQIIKSKLITLSLSGDMLWSDNLDNQILPILGYSRDNSLIAIGEKDVYSYKNESKKKNKLNLNKTIYNAAVGEGGVAIVIKNQKGFEAVTYDANLRELGAYEFSKAPLGITMSKGSYILYYDELLRLLDLRGQLRAEFKSIPNINKAYFGRENEIIAVSDRLIQKLEYK